jgi:DNA-binding LacI/PurR family transcriptional regulator
LARIAPTGRRVTIKDIARAAGVSVTTVSDSMSGNGRLPEATRQRVREVADELGYKPSAAARSLVGSRTGLLVMSVAAPGTPVSSLWSIDFFVNIMLAAATRASTQGFALALSPKSLPPNLSYDGAIVVDPTEDNDLLVRATQHGTPLVTVGRSADGHPWVDNDYPTIIPATLDHFRAGGAQLPALLASDPATSYVHDTVEQYTLWCRLQGCTPQIAYVDGAITEAAGRAAARRLLASDPRPDAVLATLDHLALGVATAAEELGFSVPEDVMVASLGDSAMITHSQVPITAIDLAPDELGSLAVDGLIAGIESGVASPNRVVAGRLVVRASSQRHGVTTAER